MSKSILILALVCLLVAMIGPSATASAGCATCGDVENWSGEAKLDQIGNPALQQEPDQPFGPALARQTNSQFSKEEGKNKNADNSDKTNNVQQTQTTTPNIDLKNISAMPNLTSPGSPVKITAVLAGAINTNAYAIIKNSAGVQVGNVTLDHISGDEYAGSWTSSIATGIYNVTVVASSSGASKTFSDVLQIEVKESDNVANTNGKTTIYTRLG